MAHDLKVGDLVIVDHRYLDQHFIPRDKEFPQPSRVVDVTLGSAAVECNDGAEWWFVIGKPGFPVKYEFNPIEPSCEDEIEQPSHYKIKLRGQEFDAWEIIEAVHGDDYQLATVLKYVLRCKKKGALLKDLKKARAHLNRRIELLDDEA